MEGAFQRSTFCSQDDNDKYYMLIKRILGIQISEIEVASDPERHRSHIRHRRVPSGKKPAWQHNVEPVGAILPQLKELFSHTQFVR